MGAVLLYILIPLGALLICVILIALYEAERAWRCDLCGQPVVDPDGHTLPDVIDVGDERRGCLVHVRCKLRSDAWLAYLKETR